MIADLSSVWAEMTVYPKDLATVKLGQKVTVKASALNTEATGTISYVGSLVGEQTRSAKARVTLKNPTGAGGPDCSSPLTSCRARPRCPWRSPSMPSRPSATRRRCSSARRPLRGAAGRSWSQRRQAGRSHERAGSRRPLRRHQQLRAEGRDRQGRREPRSRTGHAMKQVTIRPARARALPRLHLVARKRATLGHRASRFRAPDRLRR